MKKAKIGIVTFPILESGNIPLSELIEILYSSFGLCYLITGNAATKFFKEDKRVLVTNIHHDKGNNILVRVFGYISTQIKISQKIIYISKNVDILIFFLGGPSLILPVLTSKVLGKKTVIAMAGSNIENMRAQSKLLWIPIGLSLQICLKLSVKIVIYSESLVDKYNLKNYRSKVVIAHHHYLDFEKFQIFQPLMKRLNIIGYIGRLSEEKGITNFAMAIPKVLKKRDNLQFLICGDGHQRRKIEEYIDQGNFGNSVKFAGWIPHDDLPFELNNVKLLVLPSITEGLPKVMLEAMACGTPVLVSPVGAIPDYVKDGKTGFLMENNSPECIAQNVVRALNHPNFEEIAKNGRALVEKEFTYEKAAQSYREVLGTL